MTDLEWALQLVSNIKKEEKLKMFYYFLGYLSTKENFIDIFTNCLVEVDMLNDKTR